MPRIDAHAMFLHDELDLFDDGAPSRLDAKDLRSLDDVIGCRLFADDA